MHLHVSIVTLNYGMERHKIQSHAYFTRRTKVTGLEENFENVENQVSAFTKVKKADSPLTAKLCLIPGYASPPCRPVLSSQNNDNEIEWDLTSPSARKYQVLVNDKKTSTPNRTPTRRRELRPRLAMCKKNIVTAQEGSADLANELAALNDLVNSEQAQTALTPPRSEGLKSSSDETLQTNSVNLNKSSIIAVINAYS